MNNNNVYDEIIPGKILRIISADETITAEFALKLDFISKQYDIIDISVEVMDCNQVAVNPQIHTQTYLLSAIIMVAPKTSDTKVKIIMEAYNSNFVNKLKSACELIYKSNSDIINIIHKVSHDYAQKTFCYFAFIIYI